MVPSHVVVRFAHPKKKKKESSFMRSFKKYIPRFVVLNLACTLAAFLKSARCGVPFQNSVLLFFYKSEFSLSHGLVMF